MQFFVSAFLIFLTVDLTPVFAAPLEQSPIDLRAYHWLFRTLPQKGADLDALRPAAELKTKFIELALKRNLIREQTILEESAKLRDGWVERVGLSLARSEYFKDVISEYAKQILTDEQFFNLIERPGFEQEKKSLIVQLRAIEHRSDEVLHGWYRELARPPSWLIGTGRISSQILQDKHRSGFFYLQRHYLSFDKTEDSSLKFTNSADAIEANAGLVLPMAPEFTWSRVMSSILYNSHGYRNRGELDEMKNGFAATLREQSLNMTEQLKFYYMLTSMTNAPDLYHDAAFARAMLAKYGARDIALFNAYLEHFQMEEARSVARLAQDWDLSGAAAHSLMFGLCNSELTSPAPIKSL